MASKSDTLTLIPGDASVDKDTESFILDCLSTDFDFDFTSEDVINLYQSECCPSTPPSLFSSPFSELSSVPTSVPSSPVSLPSSPATLSFPSSPCSTTSSIPSSPSLVPSSPFFCGDCESHTVKRGGVCCSMFLPCDWNGVLTPEEERVYMQKLKYRQEKLQKYKHKRNTRNWNKRVNENRSRVAQQRARDNHGHFVSTRKAASSQKVPQMFVASQWTPSGASESPIFVL
jgi:hypothetical protein